MYSPKMIQRVYNVTRIYREKSSSDLLSREIQYDLRKKYLEL